MQLQFAAQSYKARALPLSAQRCVNYFAEAAPPDAKSNVVVYNAPGIKSFASGLAGAVRGGAVMAGVLYVVAGKNLYSINSAGTPTLINSINTSSGRVSMAVNRALPQELAIVDGTDGWTYDTSNGLVQITDGDFQAADTVDFQDGYFIFNESGTSRFFISNIDDGQTYTSTDFADAEGDGDDVVAVRSNHRELWVFGERTTEIYLNTGATNFPFERISGAFIERGCAAAHSVAEDDNTLFWLADDGIVYRAAGYTPQRISTHAIEEAIRGYSDWSDAFAYFFTMSGHKFYVLSFPTGRATWVFDVATGLWHERESKGQRYWRANAYFRVYDKHLVADAFEGKIGELDLDTYQEYGSPMQGILTSPVVHNDRKRIFHERLEVEFETGVGTTSGGDPQVWMDWSDDGGRTFSNVKPQTSLGKIGAYRTRVRWLRLGQSRNRIYRLTVSDNVKRSVVSSYLDIAQGRN